MTDLAKLEEAIKESGMSMTEISRRTGILRGTLYNRLKGYGDFTASEIVALSRELHLSKERRDDIFLNEKMNLIQLA